MTMLARIASVSSYHSLQSMIRKSCGTYAISTFSPHQATGRSAFVSTEQRCFSSKRPDQQQPLTNADLITALLKNNTLSPDTFNVRLVIDHGGGQREPMEIVTLAQAIQKSFELDLDLIGVQLKQDPPVIRAQSMQKLKYKAQLINGNQTKALPTKEIKFKAGIGENDLERKAQNVIKYLDKGHPCQLTLMASKFKFASDANILTKTLEQIKEIIGTSGEISGSIKSAREGALITVTMVACKDSKKLKKTQKQEQPNEDGPEDQAM